MKALFNRFQLIINYQTYIVAALAVLSTYLCVRFDLKADFPLTLFGTAVIFPIVFSIGGAYKRREATLNEYGSLKGLGRALYYASRDWSNEPDEAKLDDLKTGLNHLFVSVSDYLHQDIGCDDKGERQVYRNFSSLSKLVVGFRELGISTGEVSRCNQYLSKMMISFERIKHIYQYRTPLTLRVYSKTFIFILPIVYGPFFAHEYLDYSTGLGYVLPVLLSMILVSLDNIQDHLENPFDKVGEDDVSINSEKFIDYLGLEHE